MKNETLLAFADKMGRLFVTHSSIPPVAGRLLGYLLVCHPEQQSINQLAEALKASRSAIVGAVQLLEHRHVVQRIREAGSRNYLISFDSAGFNNRGFDGTAYLGLADVFREGMRLLDATSTQQHARLEELVVFSEFLAERMPLLQQEYQQRLAQYQRVRKNP